MAIIRVPYFMGEALEGFDVPEPHVTVAPPLPDATPQVRMGVVCRALASAVEHDAMPVVYAGDCVAPIGVLAGLQRRGLDPLLVWFDAHGDFNTWETTPSGFIGGMPLAMITGRGEQTIVEAAGTATLPDGKVILVGARDLDPGEVELIEDAGLKMSSVGDAASALPGDGPVYIHVDVDVVDPAEMPAVNYPAPAGPSLEAVATAVEEIAASRRVVALSVSSWNPALPGADIAAAATRRLARPFLPRG